MVALGFENLDDAVKWARKLNEYQIVYLLNGLFYNIRATSELPEGAEKMASIDPINKEVVKIYNGPL